MDRLLVPILAAFVGSVVTFLLKSFSDARKARGRLFERAQKTFERARDAIEYHRLVGSFFSHPTPGPLPSHLGGNPVAVQERSGERLGRALSDLLSVTDSMDASFTVETIRRWRDVLEHLNSAKDAPGDDDFQRAVQAARASWDEFAERARVECDLTPWKRWLRWTKGVLRAGADD